MALVARTTKMAIPALLYNIYSIQARRERMLLLLVVPILAVLVLPHNLTLAEVESFLESSVKQMIFHYLFNLVYASNKVLNQVLPFKVEKDTNLCDLVKAFCTIHSTTHKALLGWTSSVHQESRHRLA